MCVYVCMYIYIYIYMYDCVYIYIYIHIYIYICMAVSVHEVYRGVWNSSQTGCRAVTLLMRLPLSGNEMGMECLIPAGSIA